MPSLDSLLQQAQALAASPLADRTSVDPSPAATLAPLTAEAEVARQMQICNACRYCEGFCAVFPAMTRRLAFDTADVHYLANLCHNCGACLYACQYAPPHEFAVNVPEAMARVRGRTYRDYAWPASLGRLYDRNGLVVALALTAALALFLVLGVALNGRLLESPSTPGNFYEVFPHNLLVGLFAPVFLFAVLALALGVRRFWREVTPATSGAPLSAPAGLEAAHDVLRLRYLDGGHGQGCNEADDAFTLARRRCHHLTFYGFMLCFAATAIGTLYHYVFSLPAPYDLPSLPKLLGGAGGAMLVIGTAGLWRLNLRRGKAGGIASAPGSGAASVADANADADADANADAEPGRGDPGQQPMDRAFIALLFLISVSGLALWLARDTAAMALLLCLHLGAVMALFLTLPYGKFAHGIYRSAALLRFAIEKRQPSTIAAASD